jgi:nucleotide-binding universal stress UspA family protein
MNKYLSKNVIVPFDFSEMSIEALKSAIEMVDSQDKVIVVHVTPYPAANDPAMLWGSYTEDNIAANLRKSFEEMCEEKEVPSGLKFVTAFGDPGSSVTQIAKEHNASLIVISSHGRSGISRMLLGSVAERVVRLSPCPVLVLRGDEAAT